MLDDATHISDARTLRLLRDLQAVGTLLDEAGSTTEDRLTRILGPELLGALLAELGIQAPARAGARHSRAA